MSGPLAPNGALDILIDMDGVIYPFPELFTPWLAGRLERDLQLDTTQWEFYASWGLDYDGFVRHLAVAVQEQQLWWTGDPYPDAPPSLARLRDAGHRLHVVTARDAVGEEAGRSATCHWLDAHGLDVSTVSLTQDKPRVLAALDLDPGGCVAVDDGAHHIAAWEAAGVYGVVLDRWGSYRGDHRSVPDLTGFADHLAALPRAS